MSFWRNRRSELLCVNSFKYNLSHTHTHTQAFISDKRVPFIEAHAVLHVSSDHREGSYTFSVHQKEIAFQLNWLHQNLGGKFYESHMYNLECDGSLTLKHHKVLSEQLARMWMTSFPNLELIAKARSGGPATNQP